MNDFMRDFVSILFFQRNDAHAIGDIEGDVVLTYPAVQTYRDLIDHHNEDLEKFINNITKAMERRDEACPDALPCLMITTDGFGTVKEIVTDHLGT
jgi:hypothetical protein